jgi:hypothetical protein
MKKTILALSLLSVGSLHAQAILSQSCEFSKDIKLPLNTSGHYMSADCKTVYILPPENGEVVFEGFTESASIKRCNELDVAMKNLGKITKKLTSAEIFTSRVASVEEDSDNEDAPFPGWGDLPSDWKEPAQDYVTLKEQDILTLLLERQTLAHQLVKEFGTIPGVVVQLNYRTGYGDLVQKYKDLNRNLAVDFKVLPLKNTYFKFNSPTFKDSQFPMALSSGFAIDQGELMSGSTSGSVELSLLGACPLRSPYSGKMPRTLSAQKIAPLLTANLSYEYELLTTLTYEASISRGGLAKKIRDVSTTGGFFSTKSASKLITTSTTESWFVYKGYCDDSRACERAHQENVLDIKKRLMDEVLGNISLVKIGLDLVPQAANAPAQNGARTSADEVKKCPHVYCQVAGAVLGILSDSLGRTSKVDSYINNESHFATETQLTRKPFAYQGSMGFSPKDL